MSISATYRSKERTTTSRQASLNTYWLCSRTPFASAVLLFPLLLAYEWAIFSWAYNQPQNGAHQLVRNILLQYHITEQLIPCGIILSLLMWNYLGKHSWNVDAETLLGMWSEAMLYAILLIAIGQIQLLGMAYMEQCKTTHNERDTVFREQPAGHQFLVSIEKSSDQSRMNPRQLLLSYVGAGIYEETLFRLIIIPLGIGIFLMIRIPRYVGSVLAILLSAFFFAFAHEVIPLLDQGLTVAINEALVNISSSGVKLFIFSFRFLAGIIFGIVFLLRGFGITVGTHLLYDVFVGIMLAPD